MEGGIDQGKKHGIVGAERLECARIKYKMFEKSLKQQGK